MTVAPYIMFSGNCAEAMTRYQQVLGGDLQVMRFADLPPGEDQMPDVDPDTVMHAALVFPDGQMIMASDDPSGDGGPKVGVSVAFTSADEATSRGVFDGLAEGGDVTMPLAPTFFSPAFGMVTDRFGVSWMVDTAQPADNR